MAGQDQSANLGGMLSQIGQTLGTPTDISGLTRNVVNMPRPTVDPTNVDDMMRLQQWQQKVGRDDEARTTLAGISELRQAQQRQEALQKEQRALQKEQQAAGAIKVVGAYARAAQDPNATPEQLDAAYAAAADYGDAYGIDTYGKLAQIDQQAAARADQAWQQGERARVEQERTQLTAFSTALTKAQTAEEISKAVEGAAPEVMGTAQQLASNKLSYIEMQSSAVDKAALQNTPIDLSVVDSSLVTLAKKSPELAASFAPRLQALKKTQEASFVNGTWTTPVSQSNAEKQFNALLREMQEQEASLILSDHSAKQAEERAYQRERNRIAVSKPSKTDYAVLEKEVSDIINEGKSWYSPKDKPTAQQVYEHYRKGQYESLDAQYGKTTTPPTDEIPQAAIDAGITKEQWATLSDGDKEAFYP